MQTYRQIHDGHVEKCCLCVPTNTGAHIIGILYTLDFLFYLSLFIAAMTSPLGTSGYVLLPGLLITGYLGINYLLMVKDNTPTTRGRFATAFQHVTHLAVILLALGAVGILITALLALMAVKIFFALEVLLIGGMMWFVALFIICHFNKVVRTYGAGDTSDAFGSA